MMQLAESVMHIAEVLVVIHWLEAAGVADAPASRPTQKLTTLKRTSQ